MRWARTIGTVALGFVLGGATVGYITYEYMGRYAIDFTRWMDANKDLGKSSDAVQRLGLLKQLDAGKTAAVKHSLEWWLDVDVIDLNLLCEQGRDPAGHARKALSMIRQYRTEKPWASGNADVDQMVADILTKYVVADAAPGSKPASVSSAPEK